ncbi:MAG: dethiobiotin synthase [Prolixibacteraceae bacterium]|jgi:dethiobiotin synthetase|nr:dethiobiotin synthase [Prolixibacteraceae bacterium]
MKKSVFVSGIDTDCGKTIATGVLARSFRKYGYSIITQKFIQTGCDVFSEDIEKHRELMNVDAFEEDLNHLTAPLVFKTPVSPHLAAEMDGRDVEISKVYQSLDLLEAKYERVLLEGAGGLMVPYTREHTTLDFIKDSNLPVILVSSSKLGSINHTLISLELLEKYNLTLHGVIYNHLPGTPAYQLEDSARVIKAYLKNNFPKAIFAEIPDLNKDSSFVFSEAVVKQFGKLG